MDELTVEQLGVLGGRLRERLGELDELLASASDRTATVDLDQPIGRVSRIDAIQQQRMAQEQRRRHELTRSQVKQALAAFEDEEYGWCRRCDEPIGYLRLKARPESPFCICCMESIESRR